MGKRVLLVDDERSVRDVLGEFLACDQHTVVQANNGAEALTLFRQAPFDLVLIDLQMPFMSGDELAVMIKRLAPDQPIIMLTGCGGSVGRDNPVDALLSKPIDLRQLRQTIARLLPEDEPAVAA